MKRMRKRQKGFTLVELLIVVAILGILAAVVIPSVLGLMGRGAAQAYETDQEVIQLTAAAFYSDIHSVDLVATPTMWSANNTDVTTGHYYPTAIAVANQHRLYIDTATTDPDNIDGFLIRDSIDDDAAGVGVASAIDDHAIWMGLLVNPAETVPGPDAGTANRGVAAPLLGEVSLYLQEMPESAMHGESGGPTPNDEKNGASNGGGYCWIVGQNGLVIGAYEHPTNGNWYAGYSGGYP